MRNEDDVFKDFQFAPIDTEAMIRSLPPTIICATAEEAAPGADRVTPSQEQMAWLEGYRGNFEYYLSLKNQYFRFGKLSPKQLASVDKAIARDKERKDAPLAPIDSTIPVGSVLQIKKWIAKELADKYALPSVWRNIVVIAVYRETDRAIQITAQMSAEVGRCCHICGLALTNKVSRATGIGPICADNNGIERVEVEQAEKMLTRLQAMAQSQGTFGPFWIPKSQYKVITKEEVC